MGLVTSCCGRRPKKSRLHSEHDLMSPHRKRHRRDISATYSPNDFVMTLDQLDINQAPEEDLMTLPGINRTVARNIIQYRNHIGGFRKAEDLALVSGIGANKLAQIRMDIYCGKYDPGNQSTPASSRKSNNRPTIPARQNNVELKIDVNKATATELSKVGGIGIDLAQCIVDYRSDFGPFKFLTEVSKVPEIGTYYFEKMRHYLTIDDSNQSVCSASTSVSIIDDYSTDSLPLSRPNGPVLPGLGGTRKMHATSATQTENPGIPPHFETMPRRKSRMRRPPSQKTGKVRLASWNLQGLSLEKVRNMGVKEVICMTLLENGLSLLACQDIIDSTALDEICAELNNPTLGPVKAWTGPRGRWTCITAPSSNQYKQGTCGFLWDLNQGVGLKHSYCLKLASNRTIQDPIGNTGAPFVGRFTFTYYPYLARTMTLRSELSVFSIPFMQHMEGGQILLGGEVSDSSSAEVVAQTIEQYFPDNESLVLACDAFPDGATCDLSTLTSHGFLQVSPPNGMSNGVQRPNGLKYSNSLLLSPDMDKYWNGSTLGASGVISEGLSHPLIPTGWSWGGPVSNHSLAWLELVLHSS